MLPNSIPLRITARLEQEIPALCEVDERDFSPDRLSNTRFRLEGENLVVVIEDADSKIMLLYFINDAMWLENSN